MATTKPVQAKRQSAATFHRSLTEDDFKAMIDDWEANHLNIKLDDKQKQFMLRVHLHMQKYMPGWSL